MGCSMRLLVTYVSLFAIFSTCNAADFTGTNSFWKLGKELTDLKTTFSKHLAEIKQSRVLFPLLQVFREATIDVLKNLAEKNVPRPYLQGSLESVVPTRRINVHKNDFQRLHLGIMYHSIVAEGAKIILAKLSNIYQFYDLKHINQPLSSFTRDRIIEAIASALKVIREHEKLGEGFEKAFKQQFGVNTVVGTTKGITFDGEMAYIAEVPSLYQEALMIRKLRQGFDQEFAKLEFIYNSKPLTKDPSAFLIADEVINDVISVICFYEGLMLKDKLSLDLLILAVEYDRFLSELESKCMNHIQRWQQYNEKHKEKDQALESNSKLWDENGGSTQILEAAIETLWTLNSILSRRVHRELAASRFLKTIQNVEDYEPFLKVTDYDLTLLKPVEFNPLQARTSFLEVVDGVEALDSFSDSESKIMSRDTSIQLHSPDLGVSDDEMQEIDTDSPSFHDAIAMSLGFLHMDKGKKLATEYSYDYKALDDIFRQYIVDGATAASGNEKSSKIPRTNTNEGLRQAIAFKPKSCMKFRSIKYSTSTFTDNLEDYAGLFDSKPFTKGDQMIDPNCWYDTALHRDSERVKLWDRPMEAFGASDYGDGGTQFLNNVNQDYITSNSEVPSHQSFHTASTSSDIPRIGASSSSEFRNSLGSPSDRQNDGASTSHVPRRVSARHYSIYY